MKKFWSVIALSFVITLSGLAQEVKVVFDVTSADIKIHQSTLRHVTMMSNAYPDSELEVVVYSSAIAMMLKEESTVRSDIEKVLKNDNISFNVLCHDIKKKRDGRNRSD